MDIISGFMNELKYLNVDNINFDSFNDEANKSYFIKNGFCLFTVSSLHINCSAMHSIEVIFPDSIPTISSWRSSIILNR